MKIIVTKAVVTNTMVWRDLILVMRSYEMVKLNKFLIFEPLGRSTNTFHIGLGYLLV